MSAGSRRGNFYSGVGLDRADHLRRDPTWLAARLADPATLFVPVWRNKNLVDAESGARAVWLSGAEAAGLAARAAEAVFLGRSATAVFFAIDVSHLDGPEADPALAGRGAFRDLRAVGPVLVRGEGAILAYARGLAYWHRRHRFCGVCGDPTRSGQGGHVRRCTNAACGADHFPRTDPAVIMLVHDGERCVLARQRIWPDGMHSTLAGFVEPGESLEEAVAREIYEEVGLEVTDITYHSSQPWPFPSSIMLGFHVHGRQAPLRVNPHELAAARWFSRAELQASPEDESFRLPRRDSIARRLIEDWLAGT
ncbi:MAG: NAD(+) diphosphatase [Kiloniellaceae bacterium]